jgi:hypothetical protein
LISYDLLITRKYEEYFKKGFIKTDFDKKENASKYHFGGVFI